MIEPGPVCSAGVRHTVVFLARLDGRRLTTLAAADLMRVTPRQSRAVEH
jgi:hypothetical protein